MLLFQDPGRERVFRVAVQYRHDGLMMIGPVSMPSSTKWTVQPERLTPCSIAAFWTCSPGKDGSRAGGMFMIPVREGLDEGRRDDPHEPGKDHRLYPVLSQFLDQQLSYASRFPL